MIILTLPDIKYKNSFLNGYKEFSKEKTFIESDLNYIQENFEIFIEQLKDLSKKKLFNPFFIPETIYWLVDDVTLEFIGRVSIRHRLNKNYSDFLGHIGYAIVPSFRSKGYGSLILKLALKKCKPLNLDKVLLTCNSFNSHSREIIKKNNGIYENFKVDNQGFVKLRYWINIKGEN
ncbi:MAG: GNAT family N-acetyltransferase [Cetobacterium sp.]|uniref:GNAT family N-acetyltransferase n=1 Tax=Cetobacterium sp. TaxID=2071632 RepID=UPI003F2E9CD1